ncbi:MAG: helicase HerA-like domain-containing protein [Pseudomonadota bacterium]
MEDCGAILGRRGAGKSGAGRSLLEHELTAGHRCCVIDPKGDWWGIRMNPDQSASDFEIPIFGGVHGDVQLTEHMGPTLGETVAKHDLSCLVDISEFPSQAAMRRFMLGFTQALYRHNRAPLTLFVDEADQLAPQTVPADMAKLLHSMEKLIRLGRQRGIFMWMLTQRPQILNKNLLSQAETLIAMRMVAPHDRKAIQDWLNAHDPDEAKKIIGTLPKLSVGEAMAWVPAVDFLERVQFPMFTTYDSGRTPKHGETRADVALPSIDLSGVESLLGDAVAASEGQEQQADTDATRYASTLRQMIQELTEELRQTQEQLRAAEATIANVRAAVSSSPVPAGGTSTAVNATSKQAPAAAAAPPAEKGQKLGPERKPLKALCGIYPGGLTEAQWSVAAGLKRGSGTWSTYKSRLRKGGFIVQRDGRYFATQEGIDTAGFVEVPPPPGSDRALWWAGRLKSVDRMVQALITAYPAWTSRDDLANQLGLAASGGTFSTYLSRLSGPGVIERDRERGIRLSAEVMEAS